MTRVKRGVVSRRKHKKVLSRTKGYRMTNNRLIKRAKEADLHAGNYAFAGRKLRKRDMRRFWIMRINQALKQKNYTYNTFIKKAKDKKIMLNRKMLAVLASQYPQIFDDLVKQIEE